MNVYLDLATKLEQCQTDCAILNDDVRELVEALRDLESEALQMDALIHSDRGFGPWRGGDDIEAVMKARALLAKHAPKKEPA